MPRCYRNDTSIQYNVMIVTTMGSRNNCNLKIITETTHVNPASNRVIFRSNDYRVTRAESEVEVIINGRHRHITKSNIVQLVGDGSPIVRMGGSDRNHFQLLIQTTNPKTTHPIIRFIIIGNVNIIFIFYKKCTTKSTHMLANFSTMSEIGNSTCSMSAYQIPVCEFSNALFLTCIINVVGNTCNRQLTFGDFKHSFCLGDVIVGSQIIATCYRMQLDGIGHRSVILDRSCRSSCYTLHLPCHKGAHYRHPWQSMRLTIIRPRIALRDDLYRTRIDLKDSIRKLMTFKRIGHIMYRNTIIIIGMDRSDYIRHGICILHGNIRTIVHHHFHTIFRTQTVNCVIHPTHIICSHRITHILLRGEHICSSVIVSVQALCAHNQHTIFHYSKGSIDLSGIVVIWINSSPVDGEGVVAHTTADLLSGDIIGNRLTRSESVTRHRHFILACSIRIKCRAVARSKCHVAFGDHHGAIVKSKAILAGHIHTIAHHCTSSDSVAVNTDIGRIHEAHRSRQHITIG